MAVRPWENRFLDINQKDGVPTHDTESADVNSGTKTRPKPVGRKPVARLQMGQSYSEGSGSSSSRSVSMPSVKSRTKPSTEEGMGEVMSRPSGMGPRSLSNPKERSKSSEFQSKKRLSLQGNGKLRNTDF